MSAARFPAAQRQRLVDALLRVGPQAPTLCAGWSTRELAAHLVIRERRPDSWAGVFVPPLSGWTARVQRRTSERPFEELVDAFRAGPPRLSPYALPAVERIANTPEYFVHCEDVLRAQSDADVSLLAAGDQDVLWRLAISPLGRALYRKSPVGVVLVAADGRRRVAHRGCDSVTLTGKPSELVMYGYGRTGHATVDIGGGDDVVERFRTTTLSV